MPDKLAQKIIKLEFIYYLESRTVNDGVSPELCSLGYVKVENVAQKLLQLGPGALMAKINVKSAYHVIPIVFTGYAVGW